MGFWVGRGESRPALLETDPILRLPHLENPCATIAAGLNPSLGGASADSPLRRPLPPRALVAIEDFRLHLPSPWAAGPLWRAMPDSPEI